MLHIIDLWGRLVAKVEDLCDLITWPWPRWLLRLPLSLRLSLCLLSFLLCQLFTLLYFSLPYNWCLLTIPMGLSSWLFLKRGACLCYFSTLFFMAFSLHFHVAGASWNSTSLLTFLCNASVLFIEGSAFVSLHKLLANAEKARLEAESGRQLSTQAYEQQLRLNYLKNHFIINVNHELRTPLTTLYGYLEMLQVLCSQAPHLEPLMTKSVENALSSCTELTTLVNTVLHTLEVEQLASPLCLEPVQLLPLVQELLAQLAILFPEHAHPVTLDLPLYATVFAHRRYLATVLYNLLSNAFLYTDPTTPLFLSVGGGVTASLTLCIADRGPGIPPEEIPLLFQQFIRLERDLAGPTRGAGLGLYVSKLLIEAMGGRIWAASSGIAGEGARFYISLPVASSVDVASGVR